MGHSTEAPMIHPHRKPHSVCVYVCVRVNANVCAYVCLKERVESMFYQGGALM